MTPGQYNFSVVRGASGAGQGLKLRLKAGDPPVNLAYDDVRLTVNKGSSLLFRCTLENARLVVTDAGEAEIEWQPTIEETRLIPKGPRATYELEVRNGGYEAVYLMGTVTGIGGINDDLVDEEAS